MSGLLLLLLLPLLWGSALGCGQTADIYVGSDVALDLPADTPPPAPPQGVTDPGAAGATDAPGSDAGSVAGAVAGAGAGEPPPAPIVAAPDAGPAAIAPPVCGPALADCDGDPANGCETDIRRDPLHCGGCDVACGFPDCACEEGLPVLRCPPARDDCDGNPDNGCEVDVSSDPAHCGACGRVCDASGPSAQTAQCQLATCTLTCTLTFADCDGDPANGCETNVWYNNQNCGACGVVCSCHDNRCE